MGLGAIRSAQNPTETVLSAKVSEGHYCDQETVYSNKNEREHSTLALKKPSGTSTMPFIDILLKAGLGACRSA